ncbi:MAG: S66 peptidase family protein, partial [Patescibacteria group bacterium]
MKRAQKRLLALGFKITFGQHVREKDSFDSSSIKARISDLHTAFRDTNVRAVLCVIGGYNANQLLDYLDYNLIRRNPKIFCGYSDITVLTNAICSRSGLVTYSGPSFSSFAMKRGFDYSLEYFLKCLISIKPFIVRPSLRWSDDIWHKNQSKRTFVRNRGPWSLRRGTARGKIVGGNLCTFNLLQGTKHMPSLRNTILFIEEDDLVKGAAFAKEFGRNLQSFAQQPGFRHVRGLVFGRFQKKCLMTDEKLRTL